ncbi:MAG: YheT family hydrolase [Syntrophales bacterium]
MEDRFTPAPWARSPHLQTIFGSLSLRTWGQNEMTAASREMIIDAGDGARLLGYHSPQQGRKPNGLIVLLHGWEGSSDSTYMLSTGRFFYRLGYDVFRLNLRDHGRSHQLNQGLFHGALTEETSRAVVNVCRRFSAGPRYLVAFSLGGNFALRIALRPEAAEDSLLSGVFSISPPLDPHKATVAIDSGFPAYRRYFLAKWKRSLKTKQRQFPDLYDFDSILHHRTCMGLTEAIMPYYPQFGDHRSYFRQYTLTGDTLRELKLPVTIFIAADDPVVDAEDFRHLPQTPLLTLSLQRYGGHCGFLAPFPWGCWYERRIARLIGPPNQA